jgi:hypothetical protein
VKYLHGQGSYDDLGRAWQAYHGYIESERHRLPAEVVEFALATWHYDPQDHRSLHDSWIEHLIVREQPASEPGRRQLEIVIQLLGPYHDGITTLHYSDVRQYEVSWPFATAGNSRDGHGDWLTDEIHVADDDYVVHTILFASGARWTIACKTIIHSTTIPELRET